MFAALFHCCAVLHVCIFVYTKSESIFSVLSRDWGIMFVYVCLPMWVLLNFLLNRAREREKKDDSVYSGSHRLPFIMHTNWMIHHKLNTVELVHSIQRERESWRVVCTSHVKTKQYVTLDS